MRDVDRLEDLIVFALNRGQDKWLPTHETYLQIELESCGALRTSKNGDSFIDISKLDDKQLLKIERLVCRALRLKQH